VAVISHRGLMAPAPSRGSSLPTPCTSVRELRMSAPWSRFGGWS
jgi:hypothetical protein